MKKIFVLSLTALFAGAFAACNSSTNNDVIELSSSTAVNSFSLSADTDIMSGLDSVFFSIDLERAQIFNADSLPHGTAVNKLVPIISVNNGASAATLTVTRPNGTDTVYNYLTNSTDSIDFTYPVKLSLTSMDGTASRDYTIKVNVHKLVGDSLAWSQTARRRLPSSLSAPIRQHTSGNDNAIWCLTNAGNSWSLSKATTPDGNWDSFFSNLPENANIESFTVTDDALYILADGALLSSTDGVDWSETNYTLNYIYGAYGSQIVGAKNTNGTWQLTYYPSGVTEALPEGMPVSGASQAVKVEFPFADAAQIYITGGIMADGNRTGHTWAYDGNSWACISSTPIPTALSGMVMIPYYNFIGNGGLYDKKYTAFIAFGGSTGKAINRTVYISDDYGLTWRQGDASIQLPSFVPSVNGAQAFVAPMTLHARSNDWESLLSRATKPVSEWECPFIYLFGGVTPEGTLSNYVYRGALNRFTFKPIQ